MRKSLNAWTVDSAAGFADMFRQVKAAGFDGIELNVDEDGHSAHSLSLSTADGELAGIKALSRQHGLPVVSISSSMLGGYRMGAPDEADRALAKRIIRAQLKYAKALDAQGVLVVPGGVKQQNSLVKAWEVSMQTLKALQADITAAGVLVGLENVWNGFFLSPFDMARFVDEADHPLVCAYLDVGNMVAFSDPEVWIEALGKRIKLVHVKDYKYTGGGPNGGGAFADLTEGSVRWAGVAPALRNAGFDGYLTAEVSKEDKGKSYEAYYRETAEALNRILAL